MVDRLLAEALFALAGRCRFAFRASPRLGRKLRLLGPYGRIRKLSGAHRCHVTPYGRKAIGAILTARYTTLKQLIPKAASPNLRERGRK
jgi:hypothetical protein